MKKQKKPIILVLFLAILFGVVAFMNKPATPDSPEAPKTPAQAPEEKKADVGSDVANQFKNDSKTKPGSPKALTPDAKKHMRHGPGGPGGPDSGMPTILKAKIAPTKPKPNDSSTSTQWYTDESARKLPPK